MGGGTGWGWGWGGRWGGLRTRARKIRWPHAQNRRRPMPSRKPTPACIFLARNVLNPMSVWEDRIRDFRLRVRKCVKTIKVPQFQQSQKNDCAQNYEPEGQRCVGAKPKGASNPRVKGSKLRTQGSKVRRSQRAKNDFLLRVQGSKKVNLLFYFGGREEWCVVFVPNPRKKGRTNRPCFPIIISMLLCRILKGASERSQKVIRPTHTFLIILTGGQGGPRSRGVACRVCCSSGKRPKMNCRPL